MVYQNCIPAPTLAGLMEQFVVSAPYRKLILKLRILITKDFGVRGFNCDLKGLHHFVLLEILELGGIYVDCRAHLACRSASLQMPNTTVDPHGDRREALELCRCWVLELSPGTLKRAGSHCFYRESEVPSC